MKPKAIICDIDGTLAIRGERGPHDLARVSEDTVNIPVATVIKALAVQGFDIIFTSGRDEQARDDTIEWIDTHVNLLWFDLHMRTHGDGRPDSVIKQEMLDIIQASFEVFLVLDDRDSVVIMWRNNNIPTWQVNYGSF